MYICDPFNKYYVPQPREKFYPRALSTLPPPPVLLYNQRSRGFPQEIQSFLSAREAPSPSRDRPALYSPALSLFVSQLNNANNSLLLLQYPVPNCGCHANAVSYQEFVDDCVLVVETNSMTMRPRSHVNGCVDPIMFLNITQWSRAIAMYLEFKHPTVEAESNFDIMAYFIN